MPKPADEKFCAACGRGIAWRKSTHRERRAPFESGSRDDRLQSEAIHALPFTLVVDSHGTIIWRGNPACCRKVSRGSQP